MCFVGGASTENKQLFSAAKDEHFSCIFMMRFVIEGWYSSRDHIKKKDTKRDLGMLQIYANLSKACNERNSVLNYPLFLNFSFFRDPKDKTALQKRSVRYLFSIESLAGLRKFQYLSNFS